LPADLAQRLARDATTVAALAADSECSAHGAALRLRDDALGAVDARRVPRALREQLLRTVNDLAARLPACTPEEEHGEEAGKGGQDHGKGRRDHGKGRGHRHGKRRGERG
jgi:hypothetical protein